MTDWSIQCCLKAIITAAFIIVHRYDREVAFNQAEWIVEKSFQYKSLPTTESPRTGVK